MLAVLLPTAGADVIRNVTGRIVGGVRKSIGSQHALSIAVAVLTPETKDPASLVASLKAGLEQAEAGGDPVVVGGPG